MIDFQSILGYSKGSPYSKNPYLDIHSPSGTIDMSSTPMDLLGIDEHGNQKYMKANSKNPYQFEGKMIREIPIKKMGGKKKMFQTGGAMKQDVTNVLDNLPILSPDARYASYQNMKPVWDANVNKVPLIANTQYPGDGSYFNTGAPVGKKSQYEGDIVYNPSKFTAVDNFNNVVKHEIYHAAMDGTKDVPDWLNTSLMNSARNPNAGDHADLYSERLAMLPSSRGLMLNNMDLPYNSNITQDQYNNYMGSQFNGYMNRYQYMGPNYNSFTKSNNNPYDFPAYNFNVGETLKSTNPGQFLPLLNYQSIPGKMQVGGLFDTNKPAYADSVLTANKKLDWVKRLYQNNTPSIQVPGEKYRSTTLMSDDGKGYVFPGIQMINGKLTYLGNGAEDYARKTGTGIQLPAQQGTWFADNGYKQGPGVLQGFQIGGPFSSKAILGANPFKFQAGGAVKSEIYNYIFGDDEDTTKPAQTTISDEDEGPTAPSQQEVDDANQQDQNNNIALSIAMEDGNPYAADDNSASIGSTFIGNPYSTSSMAEGFRSFSSPQEGQDALKNQLDLYKSGKTRNNLDGNSTLLQAMSRYAPLADGNNPYLYAKHIADNLGITVDTPISKIDTDKWAEQIAKFEGNKTGNNPGNLRF